MGALDLDLMASVFGILGTIVAFLVYLAPLPTFYWIFKKKSTQGFPSIPYSVSLFSAMLTFYYAFVKTNCLLLITINSIGCFIETVYLVVFMIYATPKSRRQVIKTKSVEYMSFPLSLSLTLCAVMWFFYGLLIRDLFIAAPNVLGFAFGIVQMIMILVYRKKTKIAVLTEFRLGDLIPSVAAPLNDDMTVAIVINSRSEAGDGKKSSETDDDQNPLEGRPKGKATLAAAYGVILRRGSI
ncbi:bidirectional sugar transporter SWEET14 isoform X2 [Rosa chinensis]|uniref:bidirectional sugar transporter SWEET14 isoform X2 n=1 Tax=Rosa chinensis TaxID=74649 RepID=UPI000D095213|nr:bidirectional sugar transporter SWEET14 isoform X2 [Rosa chinensis]